MVKATNYSHSTNDIARKKRARKEYSIGDNVKNTDDAVINGLLFHLTWKKVWPKILKLQMDLRANLFRKKCQLILLHLETNQDTSKIGIKFTI